MPDPSDMLVRLPDLIAGMLVDFQTAFRRVNAGTLESLGFAKGPIFRMGNSEIQMRGRMAQAEGHKIFFFPAEQSERGAEFSVSLPVNVEHPPDDPWGLAAGMMVFDEAVRKKVYKAAIKALSFVSMNEVGAAPVWRTGPGEYLVMVPGERLRAAAVTISGSVATGTALDSQEALWAVLGRLVADLASRYEAVVGRVSN